MEVENVSNNIIRYVTKVCLRASHVLMVMAVLDTDDTAFSKRTSLDLYGEISPQSVRGRRAWIFSACHSRFRKKIILP